MPQISTQPQAARPVIDATVPGQPNSPVRNISDADKKRLQEGWDKKAEERRAAVERQTALPDKPSRILRFELRQFGHLWQSYIIDNGKSRALVAAPSLLSSALGALEDEMELKANGR